MTPRQLLDTLGPRDREPIYCVTARGKTGGAYSRTFRGRNAAQDGEVAGGEAGGGGVMARREYQYGRPEAVIPSSRRQAIREGHRDGHRAKTQCGIMGRPEARNLVKRHSAHVPGRWYPLYVRAFVREAVRRPKAAP